MRTKELLTERGNRLNAVDAIFSSPSLFVITLGISLICIGFGFKWGTWPAILVIWGGSLILAGTIAQAVRQWARRNSY